MFLLYNYDRLGFTKMQKLLKTTSGNLDHHLKILKNEGWVNDFIYFSPRPLKMVKITSNGGEKLEIYLREIENILNSVNSFKK
ncbi:hypothetical protein NEF87_004760 [Candidatus Lokiarchaeum ossiferum]|uniref:Winged helix DNA-binding domain-containing protein n=1 Tax=Candidatus Lokiarchaeum ossiferum TaxID=2951803 RepID=A0ABY6HY61_9ARCH|nr:hypothetical protein NEF87_004760 [Candidatus Lokiarchaeum sp. B-35]